MGAPPSPVGIVTALCGWQKSQGRDATTMPTCAKGEDDKTLYLVAGDGDATAEIKFPWWGLHALEGTDFAVNVVVTDANGNQKPVPGRGLQKKLNIALFVSGGLLLLLLLFLWFTIRGHGESAEQMQ